MLPERWGDAELAAAYAGGWKVLRVHRLLIERELEQPERRDPAAAEPAMRAGGR